MSGEYDEIEDDTYDEIEEGDKVDLEEFEPSDEPDEFNAVIESEFEPLDEKQIYKPFKNAFLPNRETETQLRKEYHHNKIIGNISEMNLIKCLQNNKRNILIPFGNSQRYDFLCEENGEISRIQVKTANKSTIEGEINFIPYTYTKQREKRSYKGDIEYFAIYNKEKNNSYLVPINDIVKKNEFQTFKINNRNKERYRLTENNENKNKVLKESNEIKIQLIKKGKIVLKPLGKTENNIILFDENLKNHKFIEKKVSQNREIFEKDRKNVEKVQIAIVNISADLIANGFIISEPIKKDLNYDLIIEKKYNVVVDKKFYKVKVVDKESIERKKYNDKFIDKSKGSVDFFAFYDEEINQTYLIPQNDINNHDKQIENYSIKPDLKMIKSLNDSDRGEALEMRIAAEFVKKKYYIYYPIVGEAQYDLVAKKDNRYYTIQVKSGRIHHEKKSTYLRFETSSLVGRVKSRSRSNYRGKIDFIATVNIDNLNCYIIPVNKLPKTDAKLKIDDGRKKKQVHHGTIWAEDQHFRCLDQIIKEYDKELLKNEKLIKENQILKNLASEERNDLEAQQILSLLRGKADLGNIKEKNSNFNKYIERFLKFYPKQRIEYQGVISVSFRDFLISQPAIRKKINEFYFENHINKENQIADQEVYKFIDDFYAKNGRGPNTIELYQAFLNFKSYKLRSKINSVRINHPEYYRNKTEKKNVKFGKGGIPKSTRR